MGKKLNKMYIKLNSINPNHVYGMTVKKDLFWQVRGNKREIKEEVYIYLHKGFAGITL